MGLGNLGEVRLVSAGKPLPVVVVHGGALMHEALTPVAYHNKVRNRIISGILSKLHSAVV